MLRPSPRRTSPVYPSHADDAVTMPDECPEIRRQAARILRGHFRRRSTVRRQPLRHGRPCYPGLPATVSGTQTCRRDSQPKRALTMTSDSRTARRNVLGVRLEEEIQAQKIALESRVKQSGLYAREVAEFEIAWKAYRDLHGRIGIEDDFGSLTTSESRNLVRRVRLRDGVQAVVKVVGNTREPGEGEVLKGWHHSGLPCVEPINWGYQRVLVGDGDATQPSCSPTTFLTHQTRMNYRTQLIRSVTLPSGFNNSTDVACARTLCALGCSVWPPTCRRCYLSSAGTN